MFARSQPAPVQNRPNQTPADIEQVYPGEARAGMSFTRKTSEKTGVRSWAPRTHQHDYLRIVNAFVTAPFACDKILTR